MAGKPAKKSTPASKSSKDFFKVPEKKMPAAQSVSASRVRLGGLPLETRAGFELLAYRVKQLLKNDESAWNEIERDEHGSFWTLFLKYHVPFLVPTYVFFVFREFFHFFTWKLLLRHVVIIFPMLVLLFAGYVFVVGLLAEETAEAAGARFSPQNGLRVAIFSSLILSFMSVGLMLPVVSLPLGVLALYWHFKQLMQGSRTLLNIPDSHIKIYKWSHALVWALLGLTVFLLVSVISFLSAKLGIVSI